MRPSALLICISLSLAAASAAAQPGMSPGYGDPPTLSDPVPPPEESYGRSIAVSDGIAAGLMTTALFSGLYCWAESWDGDSGSNNGSCELAVATFFGGLGTYALVPAIIHGREGQGANALASIALRVGAPVAAGYLAHALTDDDSLVGWAVVGGIGTAVMIDWLVLAKKPAVGEGGYAPAIMPTRGGATFGLGGRF